MGVVVRRWGVEIVGVESRSRVELSFLRFVRRRRAERWVARLNDRSVIERQTSGELVYFILLDRRA